jgi:hypothetical protein
MLRWLQPAAGKATVTLWQDFFKTFMLARNAGRQRGMLAETERSSHTRMRGLSS